MSQTVAFSLGSNLGDRQAYLHAAARKLVVELEGASLSSLWETEPVEVKGRQPAYLNSCVVGKTELSPRALLELCERLECEAGRKSAHRESRVLDVDLLLLADQCLNETDLVLPHPGLARRRFVLAPLWEVLPDWVHPMTGKSVMEMLEELGEAQAVKLHKPLKDWWND
ncbi:2-amino-4-hydroxy-6-hydroxymethyldihydropteridine diphosphokinase [bacterium]|nr:2-amino-4-hydroxy-6-hydroxymethyldihydropteridine diphosphokinase [bacterium]